MRISDWSSDVCSSDLRRPDHRYLGVRVVLVRAGSNRSDPRLSLPGRSTPGRLPCRSVAAPTNRGTRSRISDAGGERGRRSDRKSGGEGKRVSVRVDLGGGRTIKKKKKQTKESK